MRCVPGDLQARGRFDEVDFSSFHLHLPLVGDPANLTHRHMKNLKVAEIGLSEPEFRLWAGPDGPALRDRAQAGELSARRELELRWDSFQALRAIRRNRRKVPDQAMRDLRPVHMPDWSDREMVRAYTRLLRGPRPRLGRRLTLPEHIIGPRRVGRPRRRGVPKALWREARDTLSRMICSQRRGRVLAIDVGEQSALNGCGVILTPSPDALIQSRAPDGEARVQQGAQDNRPTGRSPSGEVLVQQGGPLWFELFWQEKLFWRAVGVAPPGLRKLVERLGAYDSGHRRSSRLAEAMKSEYDQRIRRVDRAATWFLERVFSKAGHGWRPRSISARAKKESEAQAAKMKAATRELERLAVSGGQPSRALIELATSRVGVSRTDWEGP